MLNGYDYEILNRKYGVRVFLSWNGISKPNIISIVSLHYDRYRIIYIGRDERKGLKDMISIIPFIVGKVPKASFVLIGPNVNLQNTTSYVFVSERKKWSLLCSSGLLVSPTYHEAFSLTIAEALLCGLPVITYDLPELKAIYSDCRSVFFVKKGDLNALRDAIIKLMNIGDEEYKALRTMPLGAVVNLIGSMSLSVS